MSNLDACIGWEKSSHNPKIRTGITFRGDLFIRAAQIMYTRRESMYPLGFKQGLIDSITDIRASLLDYGDHAYDFGVPTEINTVRIARSLGLTQEQFATTFRIPLEILQAWETGQQVPDDAMKAYISSIDRNPNAVLRSLTGEE